MENPLLSFMREQARVKKETEEMFATWFESRIPEINPMLAREDCWKIFSEAFGLGCYYSVQRMLEALKNADNK